MFYEFYCPWQINKNLLKTAYTVIQNSTWRYRAFSTKPDPLPSTAWEACDLNEFESNSLIKQAQINMFHPSAPSGAAVANIKQCAVSAAEANEPKLTMLFLVSFPFVNRKSHTSSSWRTGWKWTVYTNCCRALWMSLLYFDTTLDILRWGHADTCCGWLTHTHVQAHTPRSPHRIHK